MAEIGRYDSELQMFVEEPKVKMKTLLFHRWRAENNRRTFSTPAGEFALALTLETGLPIERAVEGAFVFAMQQDALRRRIAATSSEALRRHIENDGSY